MAGDWIKLHRKCLDSRVWNGDEFVWKLWCWCLVRASWKGDWKHSRKVESGQFVTGRHEAAEQLNCSPSKWYRGMRKLQDWGQIRMEANSKFTVVSVLNWSVYQGQDATARTASEQQVNSEWTASEQRVNTLKKERKKEGKKERKIYHHVDPDPFVEAWNSAEGVRKIGKMSESRLKSLRSRMSETVAGRPWLDVLIEVLSSKFPLKTTLGSPDSWKPDGDWILKPDSLLKIVECKYDWTPNDAKNNGRSCESRIGPGQRYDPDATKEEPGIGF